MRNITSGETWKCPLCDYETFKGEPHYYASGNDREIQELECKIEMLDRVLTHIITEHVEVSN